MASEPVAATHRSRLRTLGRWLRDRIWATLDSLPGTAADGDRLAPEVGGRPDEAVLRAVHDRLCAELETEADRRRAVETKLVAVGSVAPVAVTIMVAVATFLSSGHARDFTPTSVIVVAIAACYAALQFLRAMLAAIRGLSRMTYAAPTVAAILPTGSEGVLEYLRHASNDLARALEQHRETTNEKVSQLALAHDSIINAVVVLIVAIVILSVITIWESVK